MEPKIIQLASNGAIYVNQALINFVKGVLGTTTTDINEDEKVCFMKDVDYKRDLLNVSAKPVTRVINLNKADVVIVNPDMIFPSNSFGMKGNTIDANLPDHEADDIVYNISNKGAKYVETFIQWLEIAKLEKKPRFVFYTDILKAINSGFVVNEHTIDAVEEMIQNDPKMAAQMLDNCDVEASLPFILYLIWVNPRLTVDKAKFADYLVNLRHYLMTNSYWNILSPAGFQKIMDCEYTARQVTTLTLSLMHATIGAVVPKLVAPYVNNVNIDLSYNKL